MDHCRVTTHLSTLFLVLCIILSTLLISMVIYDYHHRTPLINVSARALGPAYPGGVAKIEFRYTRHFIMPARVLDRWIVCDDGALTSPTSLFSLADKPAWPAGTNMKHILRIVIPSDIKPGQFCHYGTSIKFKRMILPDVIINNPPTSTPIKIIPNS